MKMIDKIAKSKIINVREVSGLEALLDERVKEIEQRIIEARKRQTDKTPIIKRENGRTVITKSRTGISMRQMYLEDIGYV